MRLVISALHFAWQTPGECLATATGTLGLDGVELSWHESFARPHCTRDDLAQIAACRHAPSIRLSAHIWDNPAAADTDRMAGRIDRWLGLCRQTGVGDLVIHGGACDGQREGVRRVRQLLERVLPACERARVVLNLENHYAYDYHGGHELFSEPWEFMEVLRIDSPSLKVCFDTGHANMTRNTAQLIAALGPWLNYVHLADNHGVDDDHVAYGHGTVAWADVFERLAAVGFGGTFCVEFPVRDDTAPFRACVADIRRRWPAEPPGCP